MSRVWRGWALCASVLVVPACGGHTEPEDGEETREVVAETWAAMAPDDRAWLCDQITAGTAEEPLSGLSSAIADNLDTATEAFAVECYRAGL